MKKALLRIEQALGIFFFSSMFFAVAIQIFFRYVLNRPLTWPSELAIYSFIYVIYVGSALAARRGSHVVFDIIFRKFPSKAQSLLNVITNIFLIVVLLSTFPGGISYIKSIGSVRSSALGIPWTFILISLLIGMALIVFHLVGWIVYHAREFRAQGKR